MTREPALGLAPLFNWHERLSRRLLNVNFAGQALIYRRDSLTAATSLWIVLPRKDVE